MTKTDAILAALTRLAERRRAEWDRAEDLRGLTIELKFTADHLEPRAVVDSMERERRRDR